MSVRSTGPTGNNSKGTESLITLYIFFLSLFAEVSRNDSCPDLPEIQNGWKTTSHIALVRGARITYQCDPGYDLVGQDTLTCQLDLSWSSQPPFCEKSESQRSTGRNVVRDAAQQACHRNMITVLWSSCVYGSNLQYTIKLIYKYFSQTFVLTSIISFSVMYCSDPGHVEHSTRSLSDPKLLVGTTIQYSCNPGFVLQGGATITCYGREPGTPVWTSGLPHCVCKWSG